MKIMDLLKMEQAVLNNALWCAAVCATHGTPGEWRETAWVNWRETPPFYPNMVTLGGPGESRVHQECVRELARAELPSAWAVKDSFRSLALEPLGFEMLFVAEWLCFSTTSLVRESACADVSWEVITTVAALEEWEKAWSGDSGVRNLFLPQLLDNSDVAFLAARTQGQIVAGCIANRAAGCVGLSNIYLPAEGSLDLRRNCIANAQSVFPGFPLVGYESGDDLSAMKELGFEAVGELCVWLHQS